RCIAEPRACGQLLDHPCDGAPEQQGTQRILSFIRRRCPVRGGSHLPFPMPLRRLWGERQGVDGFPPARREVAATRIAATAEERVEAYASMGHSVGGEEWKLVLPGLCLLRIPDALERAFRKHLNSDSEAT